MMESNKKYANLRTLAYSCWDTRKRLFFKRIDKRLGGLFSDVVLAHFFHKCGPAHSQKLS